MADTSETREWKFTSKPNPALHEASEWIKKFTSMDVDGELPITDTQFFTADGKGWVSYENTVAKVAKELEKNRNMASAVLELCGFDRAESEKTVKTLIEELEFYSQDNWPFLDDADFSPAKSLTTVEFNAGVADLPLLGRILGPALRFGRKVTFSTAQEKPCSFYGYLVKEVLVKCGVPLLFAPHPVKIQFHPDDNKLSTFHLGPGRTNNNNAMIIFENSDLFSASKCLIESVWEYQGETYWAPSYVYVQESKFDTFVRLLKFDAVNFIEMLGIESKESLPESSPVDPLAEGLQVFQPCDSPHFKFCFGWNPQLLNSEKETGIGVAVLPFRTADEGIKAVNALPNQICASVWTEKLGFSSQVASQLKVDTVWVNCHGLLDPRTSFGSGSKSVPLNGPELFAQLLLVAPSAKPDQEEALSLSTSSVSHLQEFHKYVKNDEEARSYVKNSSSLPLHERISLLRPLQKLISSLSGSFDGVWPPEYSYRVSESGRQITSLFRPSHPQLINVIYASAKSISTALALVHYSIYRGAGVIFRTPYFKTHLVHYPELLDLCAKGFLCFVSESGATDAFKVVMDSKAILLYLHGPDGRPGNEFGVNFPVENSRMLPFVCNMFSRPKHVIVY